ncbi:MAG: EFR1 family ferrodoxin [Actinobacteria bacterium]|nr:EFR1 family ferrodoxin [Actinomycetota bacterium]MCG2819409.1 EFR1 family ferrodoxin [Actinomycetes bacterium]MBU4218643.1 EFR1 family ferrodoxin [Actinomycetota bacterium]MBU4359904.1 EFR1 family ferrodoxin [Actinomycetota bacterium]MBU4392693.1 EFR1 family ferrodoxin [Actinomycetota bacterium]
MNSKAIDFYYFTGTGNTLLVARKMAETFSDSGIEVNFRRIESSDPADVDLSHTLGIAFPVACQSTYLLVWKFLRALPECDGTEVFMVDTMQSFSGAIVGPLRKVLKKKGYRPIGAKEIVMPGNWFPKRINEEKNAGKVTRGLDKAAGFAQKIVDGSSRWRRVPVLSDGFYWICSRPKTWEMMAKAGEKFTVDVEKCNGCGICEKLCPVGNVTAGEPPSFGGSCQQCMRCISFCPSEAILVPDKEYALYSAVKVKEILGD